MAGDTIGCTARKKSRNKAPEKSHKTDNDDPKVPELPKATRGGLRVYKIVMLGSGFVGKSGMAHTHVYNIYNVCVYVKVN